MAIIGQGITHKGLVQENFETAFYISGTVVAADVGKPVALDITANHTVKLAADDDVIVGVLTAYEDRAVEGVKVATVGMKGGFSFTGVSGHAVLVGDTVISAGGGEVKARRNAGDSANETDPALNIVTSVDGDTIEVLLK